MDTAWFHEALEHIGATQADLARHLALAPSAVSRMLMGSRQMKAHEVVATAAFLQTPVEEVLKHAGAPGDGPAPQPGRRGRPPRPEAMSRSPTPWRDDIPIRNSEAARPSDDEPVGYAARPPNLVGVRDAYAVYMPDEHLAPRYQAGWLLYVNPFKPPIRGRDVVVHKTDRSLLVGQFVGWEYNALVLRQLAPEKTERLARGEVAACDLIVGVDQEG
jgi:hypothetical protein